MLSTFLSSVAGATPAPGTPASVGGSAIAVVGTITLMVAMLVAAWCVAAGIAGNARENRRLVSSSVRGLFAFTALAGLASALLIYAFVTHDYSIKYVAGTSDTSMSLAYKVTAFWGALDGSLLFWVLLLALFSTVAIWMNHRRHRDMIGYVVATIMVVQLFFLALLVFGKNPFATGLTDPPADGRGLNPLLQNYWMVIHPPSLYIGFVAATIPFAFAIGALASGRLDDLWLSSVRVWTLICFFFLTLGLILGGRWAYEELGWGGYWAWDPVENAGFLPWFTATAFLHSAIIQEQRGMLKTWNMVLVVLTFFLTIFGTFMTRAGVVQSVHAFGEDNELAVQFILFMVFILVVSIGLIIYRSNRLGKAPQLESFASREFAFLLNNWILLGCAFFVLFATMFPTISEAIDGTRVSVGIGFFNRWMTPLGLVLLLLAGVAPLLAWRRTTRERLWNQFMIPIGVAVAVVTALALLVPSTRVTTAVFAKSFNMPMPLITYGFIAFVWASVGQEFWRGVAVRRRQTGSDPVTSLIGLVFAKRRKYGGYIVHAGIGVLFLGFSGKSYDQMGDRTVMMPAQVQADAGPPAKTDPAWFSFNGYQFLYEDLIESEDDSKSSVTAKVSLWQDGEKLAVLYPARWDFHRGEQPTTEVAIHTRLGEDVYVVLTGFGRDSQTGAATGMANFRVYQNPLIMFVWFGYICVALGTLICLLPKDLFRNRPSSLLGKIADVSAVAILFGTLTIGAVVAARPSTPGPLKNLPSAQSERVISPSEVEAKVPPAAKQSSSIMSSKALARLVGAAGEHVVAGGGMNDDGRSYADKHRPTSATASSLMNELVCMCGGCQRETLFDCKCAFAAQEREQVNAMLAKLDLSTPEARKVASNEVIAAFVKEYGGEQVLSTPRSTLSWLFPSLAVIGGLALLFAVGRRWVGRGQQALAAAGTTNLPVDQTYADRLDDELRETD